MLFRQCLCVGRAAPKPRSPSREDSSSSDILLHILLGVYKAPAGLNGLADDVELQPFSSRAAVSLAGWHIQMWVRWATSSSAGWWPWEGHGPNAAMQLAKYEQRRRDKHKIRPGITG